MTQSHLNGLFLAFALLLSACSQPVRQEGGVTPNTEHAHDDVRHDDHGDDGHDDHDAHDDDDDHEDDGDVVRIDAEAQTAAGIEIATAATAPLSQTLSLPAEIRFDADRMANLSPRVSGIVARLYAGEGDIVRRGDRLALIQSRELASLKAEWQKAKTRESLARKALTREEALFSDKITSEADLQAARAEFEAAQAVSDAAENELHAAGISDAALQRVDTAADGDNANSFLLAPIAGRVVRRAVALGETVSAGDAGAAPLFTIVDESVVWADIAVFKDDIGRVRDGAPVTLRDTSGQTLGNSKIAFVLPIIDERSRTATARIVVDNADRVFRPGQFVTADISTGQSSPVLQIPESAVQTVEGRASVFMPYEDGFKPVPVQTGQRSQGQVEILAGLRAGDRFVSAGSFTLKSQLEKDAFGGGHDH
ncbi:efflux RND transporter periplasmic adaptor subunit [Algimonas porphyrae]|uniref:Cytochrome-c peroxidase n=1 Tax=Algimonas porphyrae TaxID=1128113 RepID=A0ABQ5UXD6_9PROT|nr:efflux RND transporter periplasmic adaptor subunit [Algimonas porphyrae]GLQ19512.1 cytochrome-c peroxidase [Algimonas porphyrae]